MQISIQQLNSQRGVWLMAARNGIKIRDGVGHDAPMRAVPRTEPVWFANRSAAEFLADRDVYVVSGIAPPKPEDVPPDGAPVEDPPKDAAPVAGKADARAKIEAELSGKGKGKGA